MIQSLQQITDLEGSIPWIEFSRDGQRLGVVQTTKKVLKIYDTQTWDIILQIEKPQITFTFLDDIGQRLAIGTQQGIVNIWAGGNFEKSKQLHQSKIDTIGEIGNKLVATSYLTNETSLWDIENDIVTIFSHKLCNAPYAISKQRGIVLLEDKSSIQTYDTLQKQIIQFINVSGLKVVKSSISSDCQYIACLCDDQTVRLFTMNGLMINEIQHHGSDALLIGFDWTNHHVIIGLEEPRYLLFWNIEKQEYTHRIPYAFDNLRFFSTNFQNKIAIVSTHHFLTSSIIEIWQL